jgi:hypothetical protein
MKLKLNYLPAGSDFVIESVASIDLEDEWSHSYLESIVSMNPDTIFFLTTPTTDIF